MASIQITSVGGSDSTISSLQNDNIITGRTTANAYVTLYDANNDKLATIQANAQGIFSYAIELKDVVSLLGQGADAIKAVITNSDGKAVPGSSGASTTFKINVDTKVGVVNVDSVKVAGDNIINIHEAKESVQVTGSVTNGQKGDVVSFDANGKTYTAKLDEGGRS